MAGDDVRFVRTVLAAALVLRVAVALVTYWLFPYGRFAPDEITYVQTAIDMVNQHRNWPPLIGNGWVYVNVALVWLFGAQPWLPRLLSCLAGALTIPVGYALGGAISGRTGARFCALVLACFPSLVLWSSLNLKDASVYLIILVFLWLVTDMGGAHLWRRRALAICLVLLCATLRQYTAGCLLAAGIAAEVLKHVRPAARVSGTLVAAGSLSVSLLAALVVLAVPAPFNEAYRALHLDRLARLREGFAERASSAVDPAPGIGTADGLVRFLPRGLENFLLRPFPWEPGTHTV